MVPRACDNCFLWVSAPSLSKLGPCHLTSFFQWPLLLNGPLTRPPGVGSILCLPTTMSSLVVPAGNVRSFHVCIDLSHYLSSNDTSSEAGPDLCFVSKPCSPRRTLHTLVPVCMGPGAPAGRRCRFDHLLCPLVSLCWAPSRHALCVEERMPACPSHQARESRPRPSRTLTVLTTQVVFRDLVMLLSSVSSHTCGL